MESDNKIADEEEINDEVADEGQDRYGKIEEEDDFEEEQEIEIGLWRQTPQAAWW